MELMAIAPRKATNIPPPVPDVVRSLDDMFSDKPLQFNAQQLHNGHMHPPPQVNSVFYNKVYYSKGLKALKE